MSPRNGVASAASPPGHQFGATVVEHEVAGDICRQLAERVHGFRHWRWRLDDISGEGVTSGECSIDMPASDVTKTRGKSAALSRMKKR